MLSGTISYAADNTITAEMGDTYTIGAGYYDKDTTIKVPTLASQTPGTATASDILSGKTAFVNGVEIEGNIPNAAIVAGAQTDGSFKYSIAAKSYTGTGSSGSISKLVPTYSTGSSQSKLISGGTVTLPANTYNKDKIEITGGDMTGTYGVSGAGTAGASGKAVTDTTKVFWDMGVNNMNRYVSITKSNGATASLNAGGTKTISAGYLPAAVTITANKPTGKYTVSGNGTAGASGNSVITNTSQLYWDMGETSMNRYVIIAKSDGATASLNAGGTKTISAGYLPAAVTITANKPTGTYSLTGAGTAGATGKPVTDTTKLYWDMGETNMQRYVSISKSTASATSLNPGGSASIPVGYVSSAITVSAKSNTAKYTISAAGTKGASGNAVTTNTNQMYWDMGADNLNRYVLMTHKAATTYNTSTSDQTITANQFLSGAQTIKAVTTSGISAANIKDGAVVKVGDANSATRIANVTGTFTDAATVSSGQKAAAAGQILSGYSAWVDGKEVKGSIASKGALTNAIVAADTFAAGYYTSNSVTKKGAQTYTPNTKDQTIAKNQFLTADQTVKGDTDLTAANIKTGVDLFGVTGTFTSDANATAAQILKGQTAYVNGSKVTGTMPNNNSTTSNGTVPGINSTHKTIPTREGGNLQYCVDTNGTARINIGVPEGYYNGIGGSYVNRPATEFGNAVASQVLQGTKFTSGSGLAIAGTMPARDASTQVAGNTAWTYSDRIYFGIDYGYYPAASYGGLSNVSEKYITYSALANVIGLDASKMLSGYNVLGVTGTLESPSSAYNRGVTDADNRANTSSANYQAGYNAGVAAADGRANASSANYQAGYNAGVAAAKGDKIVLTGSKGISSGDWYSHGSSHAYVEFRDLAIQYNGSSWVVVGGDVYLSGSMTSGGIDGAYCEGTFTPSISVR